MDLKRFGVVQRPSTPPAAATPDQLLQQIRSVPGGLTVDELKEVLRHVDPESIQPELTRMKARGELMRRDLLDKDEVRWTVDGSRNS